MGIIPGAALVPAQQGNQQGAQLHESYVRIRDPGKTCGLGPVQVSGPGRVDTARIDD